MYTGGRQEDKLALDVARLQRADPATLASIQRRWVLWVVLFTG